MIRTRSYGPPALGALVGLALLGLAVPHTVAAFLTLPNEFTAAAIRHGRVRNPALIDTYIKGRLAAIRWLDDGRFWANIAAANLNRGSTASTDPEVSHDANLATAALEHSLLRKPSDPYVWAQLAETYLVLQRDPVEIGKALNLSLLTGPVEWNLVLPRCRLALIVWPSLDEEVQLRFGQQFVMAMTRFGERFANLVVRFDRVEIVRNSLEIDQDQLRKFRTLVARARRLRAF